LSFKLAYKVFIVELIKSGSVNYVSDVGLAVWLTNSSVLLDHCLKGTFVSSLIAVVYCLTSAYNASAYVFS